MNTIVYIDGQNFLYKVAEILIEANLISDKQDLTSIDIKLLLSGLANDNPEIRYYGVKHIHKDNKHGEEILKNPSIFPTIFAVSKTTSPRTI